MKILLISAHEVLEASEALLIKECGHSVQTIGFFMGKIPQTNMRNDPETEKNQEFLDKFNFYNPDGYILPSLHPQSGMCNLPDDLLKDFDIIVLQYYPWMLTKNWDSLRKKNLVLRTIGFPVDCIEQTYALAKSKKPDMKIVRLSNTEQLNPYYCGHDAIIPQAFHPENFDEWTGEKQQILTVMKMFKKRADSCKFKAYEKITSKFINERVLIGSQNEDIPYAKVQIPLDELRKYMSESRVCLNMPSQPACVTYSFVEAFCLGLPIVSVGPFIGDWNGQHTFDIEKYLDGENGLFSDDIEEIQEYLYNLLNNYELAKKIGEAGKKRGLSLFHKDIIKKEWENLLNNF